MSVESTISKHWFKLVTALIFVVIVGAIVFTTVGKKPEIPIIKEAPAFSLQNLEGQPSGLADSEGKVRLLSFIFTYCPDVCPATTNNMVLLQNELKSKEKFGDKVSFISVTFDPDRDTPEVLKTYADRLGIDRKGWTLLRGTAAETKKVANDYGVIVEKLKDGSFMHSNRSLMLIDGANNIRKIYTMGEEMNNDEILQDIEQLLKEK